MDIFFVISGFLITGIVYREIVDNTSAKQLIINFYERRARRILPALFIVFLFTFIASFLWYFPVDYMRYAKSLIASNLFSSNFLFWSELGYFNAGSEIKPLLHTWSLSVEEQFYIVFPIILFCIALFDRKRVRVWLICFFFISFIMSVYTSYEYASVSFYWSPLRAWELLAGSLVALNIFPKASSTRFSNIFAFAGFALILWSLFLFDRFTVFPGTSALLPVLGTALIIEAGKEDHETIVKTFMGCRPMVFTGKISYSLYLWHWPIIVYYKHHKTAPLSLADITLILLLTFIAAYVSWRFVEQPFRNRRFLQKRTIFGLSGVGMLLFCILGAVALSDGGWGGRFSAEVMRIAKYGKNFDGEIYRMLNSDEPTEPVISKGSHSPKFALMGDSHAGVLFNEFERIAKDRNEAIENYTIGGHPPIIEVRSNRKGRHAWFRKSFEKVVHNHQIKVVYLGARWPVYVYGECTLDGRLTGMPLLKDENGKTYKGKKQLQLFEMKVCKTVRILRDFGKEVVLIHDVPEAGYDVPKKLAFMKYKGKDPSNFYIDESFYLQRNGEINKILTRIAEKENAYIIKPGEILKSDFGYLLYVNTECLYFDNAHLSLSGARFVSSSLENSISRMLAIIKNDEHNSKSKFTYGFYDSMNKKIKYFPINKFQISRRQW